MEKVANSQPTLSALDSPSEVSIWKVLRWTLSKTKPLMKPLYFSATMRSLEQIVGVLLFALAGGGLIAVYLGRANLLTVISVMILLAMVKALAYYLEQFSGHYVAFKCLELLRTTAFSSLWPKAPNIVNSMRSGDMLTSLTRDIDRIEVLYAHTAAPVFTGVVITNAIMVTAGFLAGWQLVAVPFICVLFAVFVVPVFGFQASLVASEAKLEQRRELSQHLTDSVFGAEEVVGYGRADTRFAHMATLEKTVAKASHKTAFYRALRRGANVSLPLISILGVLVAGISTNADPVVVAALMAACWRVYEGPRGVEDALGGVDLSLAAAKRLYHICHAPQKVQDGTQEVPLTAPLGVQWRNVTYSYGQENGRNAIDDLSFIAPAGKHTVVVGRSGSGKSTAMQMLLRYDDPQSGSVCLGEQDVREFSLDSLRRAVAFVPQRPDLLSGTIADNLRLGAPEATDAQLWEVLEIAGLAEQVKAMPAQLATETGTEGAALSGGQVQRLCLARALLTKPAVLVLDEFTANLNEELEQKIRQNLLQYNAGLTTIEITHRLDAVRGDYHLVELEDGKVV